MRTELTAQMTAWSAVSLLVLTACAGDDGQDLDQGGQDDAPQEDAAQDDTGQQDAPDQQGSDEDEDAPHQDAEAEAQETPGGEVPAGGSEQVPEEELPGEDVELFYQEGDELGVAGLDPEDAPLEVLEVPLEQDGDVVGELEPLDAVVVTGRQRQDPDDAEAGIWTEVELADGYGWVEGGLAYFAGTEDVTEDYIDEVPPAEDAQTIAEGVAERAAGEDTGQDPGSEWTLISTPDDYGEDFYRLDVTGLMDDSLAGYRLFVTVEDTGEGYELTQVEQTQLCQRGVAEGLCA